MTSGAQAVPTAHPTYPIDVRFDREQRVSRLWGIPIVGLVVRYILLIPHLIVLALYGIVVGIVLLVAWIPVLLTGRFASWGYDIVGGYMRWYTRVVAYSICMVGPYPPFSTAPGYPVEVDFDRSTRVDRLWGIPILGILVRSLLVIPHLIVLWILAIVVGFISWFLWIPVLIYGRFPQLGYDLVGGYIRMITRVSGWVLCMAGPYPPFGLS